MISVGILDGASVNWKIIEAQSGRISKFERGRRAEILRVYGHFVTKPKVWLIPAQANGLGSRSVEYKSAEGALHRHAAHPAFNPRLDQPRLGIAHDVSRRTLPLPPLGTD